MPTTPSSSSTADSSSSSSVLEAFAYSILTIPTLLAPAPGGRLTANQLQQFLSRGAGGGGGGGDGADAFPLWDLLATLNNKTGTSSSGQQQLRTEQTVALLANIVELAKGRLVLAPPPTTTTTGPRPVENGKQLVAYLEVLRTLLGQLPRAVVQLQYQDQGADDVRLRGMKGKGKEEEVETIVIDDEEDDEDDEGEESEEGGGGSEMDEDDALLGGGGGSSFNGRRMRRRAVLGGARFSRDQDGDESMTDPIDTTSSSSSSSRPQGFVLDVDPRIHPSLTYLWSREHLLALLSLSTRYSASTRPALCGFLVELLVPPPPPHHTATSFTGSSSRATTTAPSSSSSSSSSSAGTVRDAVLNTLLYSPLSAGLLRELFRGYIRSSELGRTLLSATKREKSAVVLAAALKEDRYRDEWPVLVLAVEMYARSLLTMGDDEFYASAASSSSSSSNAGRNPLTLDEIVTFSAMIRNATFALYWQDEGTVSQEGAGGDGGGADTKMVDPVLVAQTAKRQQNVVGMGGWSIEDVRGVMTRFLQQVHARE